MAQTQIEISAQVWVCNGCGGHDPKSCGCDSTAHAEEMAAKREAKRQGDRAYREEKKANKNNGHEKLANVENIEELDPAEERKREYAEDEEKDVEAKIKPGNYKTAFLMRADVSARYAVYSGPVDREVLEAAKLTLETWKALVRTLEERK